MKYYLVGYGSLISKESRDKTGHSGKEFPVKIKGFKRLWNIQVDHKRIGKTTFLGINRNKEFWFNAVIFETSLEELKKFDLREKSYNRIELSQKELNFYENSPKEEFKVFMYLNKSEFEGFPNEEFLISQAYVDLCILGCLKYSKKFAEDFIKTTYAWNKNIRKNRKEQEKHLKFSNENLSKVDSILNDFNLLF